MNSGEKTFWIMAGLTAMTAFVCITIYNVVLIYHK